jgi:hypothetical protein
MTTSASAQHVADSATLHAAVVEAQASDEANRAVVLNALEREDVRQMADRLGLDLKDARTAVRSLSGAELAELAQPARSIAADQSGGATTVVISVTTLLLLLILLVLIID